MFLLPLSSMLNCQMPKYSAGSTRPAPPAKRPAGPALPVRNQIGKHAEKEAQTLSDVRHPTQLCEKHRGEGG